MTDWIEHNGGPQPVGDDVWVGIVTPPCLNWWDIETMPAKEVGWGQKFEWSILNQHLIDAARLEGIRLGLEAAVKIVWKETRWMGSDGPRIGENLWLTLRNLNPDTIAKEAQHD